MKRTIITLLFAALIGAGIVYLSSCHEEVSTPPPVNLFGDSVAMIPGDTAKK